MKNFLLTQANRLNTSDLIDIDTSPLLEAYKPLVVVGPSGAGKGTLINQITSKHEDMFGFSVSFTTRQPREGEVHGTHYFFVSVEEF